MKTYLIKESDMISLADVIRSKTGGTELLSLDDMVTEIAGITTGVELNFDVVGGTTEPDNLTENMIWVNTDVEISSYIFSSVEPGNLIDGMVWISVGNSSTAAFNALKENSLMVYPFSAKQYISGAWVSVEAKSYQNGEWVNLWDGGLFESGDQFVGITGGWESIGLAVNSAWTATTPNTTFTNTINADITKTTNGNFSGVVITKNKIDLTNWTRLDCVADTLTLSKAAGYSSGITLFVLNGNSGTTEGCAVSYAHLYYDKPAVSLSNVSASIDVSALTGSYYIAIRVAFAAYTGGGTLSANISSVKLT